MSVLMCVCVFGTRTFLNILVALNTIRCLFSASTPFLAAAPPASEEREKKDYKQSAIYIVELSDGWMDGWDS